MKMRIFAFAAALFLTWSAAAQVGMNLTLNRTVYMQYEPIFACVTLRNETGRALVFGEDPRLTGFILFQITDANGRIVPKRDGEEISVTGLIIAPGGTRKLVIPVNRYYNLEKSGRYRIHAYVSHSVLPSDYKTQDVSFAVDTGAVMLQRTVGVPELGDGPKSDKAQERTYTVRVLTENHNKYLYLIVEDETHIYGVIQIGRMFASEPLRTEIDMLSRLHLLIPISPRVFHYLAFSLDGSNIADNYYKTTDTIPSLLRDPTTGRVLVAGGTQARPGVDFKDPKAGLLSAAEVVEDDIEENTPTLAPPKASGLVGLDKQSQSGGASAQ